MRQATEWPKALIFDLDGTLIDSAPDIVRALNLTFEGEGFPPFSLEDVRLMIGGGARLLLERSLERLSQHRDEVYIDNLLATFLVHYEHCGIKGTTMYPHAVEVIKSIKGQGRKLGLCTNKPEHITKLVLKELGLIELFDGIIGGGDGVPRKPDPAPLTLLLEQMELGASDCLMIGDSGADVGAARAIDMAVYVMSYGYSKIAPKELGADGVLHDLRDIAALLVDAG